MILLNPVVLSVIVMTVLCLLKLNVLLALIVSALVAGVSAHMPIGDIMGNLINCNCSFLMFFTKFNTSSYSFYSYINSTFIKTNEWIKIG